MLFLPELVYRWNFGKAALAETPLAAPLPEARRDYSRHWREEVWDLRTPHGNEVLESPFEQEQRHDALDWDPGNWYRKRWPQMRAFVLPGYSEGLIRINVTGRDGKDGIPASEFTRTCDELEQMLKALVDGRTGLPMIREIIRVRESPSGDAKDLSAADIMVAWRDDISTDVADHPVHGRIGPAPFFRTGGHSTEGFVLARGAGFAPGVRLPPVTTPDVTATFLAKLGIALPAHVEGRTIERDSIGNARG